MAVNESLIQGAYAASKPIKTTSGFAEGVKSVGESISSEVEKLKEQKLSLIEQEVESLNKTNEEYDELLDKVVNGSELEGTELGALHDSLESGRQRYLEADDKGKAIIRQELNKMYEDYEAFEDLKEAHVGLNGEMSTKYTNSKEGRAITEAFSNPSKFMKMKDGRIGMEIAGEFKTVAEINKIIEGGKKDTAFIDVFDAVDASVSVRKEDYPERGFDINSTKKTFSKYIDRSKNLNSLMNDTLAAGRSFASDFLEATDGKTYSQLGINDEMLKGADTNSDGKLSQEERLNLLDKLKQEPKILKEMLADYFTNIVAQENGYDAKFPLGLRDNMEGTFGVAASDKNTTTTTMGPKNTTQMEVFDPSK